MRTDLGGDDGVVHVVNDSGAAHAEAVEHAGQQCAEDTAHAVDAEHVQRIVRTQQFLQAGHTPEADHAGQCADDQPAADTDPATSRGDGNQACHCTGSRTQQAGLALQHPFRAHPGQHCGSSRDQGVGEGQSCSATRFQRGAGVETEPAHPQQGRADHGHHQIVRCHGFFAITDALAHHECTDQACDGGVDVHHRTTREVQRTFLEQPAGGCCCSSGSISIGVGIRTRPEPDHVCNRQVSEGEPQGRKQQHGSELHAFSKSTHNQSHGDGGESGLEGDESKLLDDNALAESGGIGDSAGYRIKDAFQQHTVETADERVARGERQRVTVNRPQHGDQREDAEHLHEH